MIRQKRWWLFLVSLLAAALLVAPAASDAFTNGHAKLSELARIDAPGQVGYMSPAAAASLNTMRACAVRDGVDLFPGHSQYEPVATAYRNGAIQRILFDLYKSGRGPPAAAYYVVRGVYVFTSNHGLGNAIDYAQIRMATWTLKHGAAFGWSHTEGARVGEWWHYVYVGGFHRPDPGFSLRFPNLRRGSGGPCQATAVKEVQRRLGLAQDGEYGLTTARAVGRFQRTHHLHVDRRVESKTWLRLRKVGRDLAPTRDPRTVGQLPGATAPMAGQDVRVVQGLLNSRFAELHRPRHVAVTGVLDQATIAAVRRFQKLRHLPITGRVDDRTYAELIKKLRKDSPKLTVTVATTNLVADFEGYRSCPYLDAVGIPTQGFGHTAGVRLGAPCWTHKHALYVLHADLNLFSVGVTQLAPKDATLGQFNGTTSFAFNVGLGGLSGSTLLREWRANHDAAAAAQFKRWDRAGGRQLLGLTLRRRAECQVFVRGSSRSVQRAQPCR